MEKTIQSEAELGWIGLGKMGAPMAGRLIAAGHALAVFDADPAQLKDPVAHGARACAAVSDLAARAGVVFSTIPNDHVLINLVEGRPGAPGLAEMMTPGSVLVEMSTVSPPASERVAETLRKTGILYLRAPISGSTDMARDGALTVLASGDKDAWARVEPLLTSFSRTRFYLGPGEEARFMKLVVNTLVGATASLLGEAIVLGERGGLTSAQMMEVLTQSAVASPLIAYKREAIEEGDFTPAFSMDQMIKDFTLITEAGRIAGVPMFATNTVYQQFLTAAEAGHRDEDFFALLSWFRSLSEDNRDPAQRTKTA